MKKPCIFIATPCYGNQVFYPYCKSLIETVFTLGKNGIECKLAGMGNESLITRARNQLVAQFLESGASHLLFIDADVSWNAGDILKMYKWDKDIIGGVYPMKKYEWGCAQEVLPDCFDKEGKFRPELLRSKLLTYPVGYDSPEIEMKQGLVKLKYIPTGFMMIHRRVFEKLIKKDAIRKLKQDGNRDKKLEPYLYNFFDCDISDDGYYLSEDYAFCHRWMKLDPDNHEIFADVTIELTHTGTHSFEGHFGLSLLPKGSI